MSLSYQDRSQAEKAKQELLDDQYERWYQANQRTIRFWGRFAAFGMIVMVLPFIYLMITVLDNPFYTISAKISSLTALLPGLFISVLGAVMYELEDRREY